VTYAKMPVIRTIRLERTPTDFRPGKVVITEGKKSNSYLVTRLACDLAGVAFRLDKIEAKKESDGAAVMQITERYNVLLAGDQSTCDCAWGVYGANRKFCRHVAGLLKLHVEGKLVSTPAPDVDETEEALAAI
jgi:hypothetical protein